MRSKDFLKIALGSKSLRKTSKLTECSPSQYGSVSVLKVTIPSIVIPISPLYVSFWILYPSELHSYSMIKDVIDARSTIS